MKKIVIYTELPVTVCIVKIQATVCVAKIQAKYRRRKAAYKRCAHYLGRQRLLCHLVPLGEEQACQNFPFTVHLRLAGWSAALLSVRPCPKSQRAARKNTTKGQGCKDRPERAYPSTTHTYSIQTKYTKGHQSKSAYKRPNVRRRQFLACDRRSFRLNIRLI